LDQQSLDAYQSGALIDQIYIDDIEKVNLRQYKTIVFTNTYLLTDTQKRFVLDKVAREGRHIVWNYMPGFSNGKKNSIAFVSDITGIKVENYNADSALNILAISENYPHSSLKPLKDRISPMVKITDQQLDILAVNSIDKILVAAKKKFIDHTVWYCTYLFDQPQVLRKIFALSGVHIYGDQNDVFYEASGLLMIHTGKGGDRTISLAGGKSVQIHLDPESTIFMDAITGKIIKR
jgi:hypothetical protein